MASSLVSPRTAPLHGPVYFPPRETQLRTEHSLQRVRGNNALADCDEPTSLARSILEKLNGIENSFSYPAGKVIFLEGQPCTGVYVLIRGHAKMVTGNRFGRMLIIRIVHPGQILGLHACLTDRPYDFTAETTQNSRVAFVRHDDFINFLDHNSEGRRQASEQISRDCQAAYDRIRTLGLSQTATEKLARLLLQWAADALVIDGIPRIKVSFTHDEIGQLIGTSRETVSRALSQLKRQHILELSGSTLLIRDKEALRRLVG
ncbi:MAG TPA: Crp/Fnr family transcriptional regulator [Acidobacteriaceae bacterium]|nr:Crp/Fnr family transcriptional regulator [Acidobacteriaceae bacterium]